MTLTEKDLIMMYQTKVRNIGLYTSISLASLGYSRYYRKNGFYRNIGGILLSISFNLMAIIFTYYIYNDLNEYVKIIEKKKTKVLTIQKWIDLLPFIAIFLILIFMFSLYTLKLEIIK